MLSLGNQACVIHIWACQEVQLVNTWDIGMIYDLLLFPPFLQDENWFRLPEKNTLGETVARVIETGVVTNDARRRLIDDAAWCTR